MKTSLLVLLSFVSSVAFASNAVGEGCPQTDYLSSQIGGELLLCKEGRWTLASATDTAKASFSIELKKGDSLLSSFVVTTLLDGQAVPVGTRQINSYLADAKVEDGKMVMTPGTVTSGLNVSISPYQIQGDKIALEVLADYSYLIAIETVKKGSLDIQKPVMQAFAIKKQVILNEDQTTSVLLAPNNNEAIDSREQYALNIRKLNTWNKK